MKNLASLVSISLLSLAACGGGGESNPKTLWLAPDNSELEVKLVGSEPPPY